MYNTIIENFKGVFNGKIDNFSKISSFIEGLGYLYEGEIETSQDCLNLIQDMCPQIGSLLSHKDIPNGETILFEGTVGGVKASDSFILQLKLNKYYENDSESAIELIGNYGVPNGETHTWEPIVYSDIELSDSHCAVLALEGEATLRPLDGGPISIPAFLSSIDQPIEVAMFIDTLLNRIAKGPASIDEIRSLFDPQGYGFGPAVNDLISVVSLSVGRDVQISVPEWINLVTVWLQSLSSATMDDKDEEIIFSTDHEFTAVLWKNVVPTILTTIGTVLTSIMNIYTQVVGAVLSIAGGLWSSILAINDQRSSVTIDYTAPNTLIGFPLFRYSTSSSNLCYYTMTMNNGVTNVSTPYFSRFLWRQGNTDIVNYELWPKLFLSPSDLRDRYASLFININESFSSASSTSLTPIPPNPTGYINGFVAQYESDPLHGISQIGEMKSDLQLLKYVALHIGLDCFVSTPGSFVRGVNRFQNMVDFNEALETGGVQSLNQVLPFFAEEVCTSLTTTSVMNALTKLLKIVRGDAPYQSNNIADMMWNMDALASEWGIYPEDRSSLISKTTFGSIPDRSTPMVKLPTFDSQLTALATVGVVVVAAAATFATAMGIRAIKNRIYARAIAKRTSIAQQRTSVDALASKYNSGAISFEEYYSQSKSYFKAVRRYNRFAGFTGLSRLDAVNPWFANYANGIQGQQLSNQSINLDPVISLIR